MTDEATTERNWYSNDTATFGDRLADARQAVSMSQKDLARRVGVKRSTLANWENDLAEPRVHRLSILSGLLNVSLRWLMTGEGEGVSPPDEEAPMPEDVTQILTEMRQVQSDMIRLSNRLGVLEKRLKSAWSSGV